MQNFSSRSDGILGQSLQYYLSFREACVFLLAYSLTKFRKATCAMLEENENVKLARTLLFVGCRGETGDRLNVDELEKWQDP